MGLHRNSMNKLDEETKSWLKKYAGMITESDYNSIEHHFRDTITLPIIKLNDLLSSNYALDDHQLKSSLKDRKVQASIYTSIETLEEMLDHLKKLQISSNDLN